MTELEFFALPPHIALRVLVDCLDEATMDALKAAPKRDPPKRPFYDGQIYRKGGFQWASETDMEGLKYWLQRARIAAVREGNEYAAADAKRAANLEKWVAWREWFPDAAWTGTRGDVHVTAEVPSGYPEIHQKEENGQQKKPELKADDPSFDPETF